MEMGREREVITEIIDMYRNFPCLWDVSSSLYKDSDQKMLAWRKLVNKMKEIEPDANVESVKKKIGNMRSSYKREFKKIQETKKRSQSGEVHIPHLWFYKLLSFLDEKEEQGRSGRETARDDKSLKKVRSSTSGESSRSKRKVEENYCVLDVERKKAKLINTAQELVDTPTKTNSFGVYVGEELEKLKIFQRQIAERLISEVLFLARTEHLDFNSKIETYKGRGPRISSPSSHCDLSTSPQHSSHSSQLVRSSSPPWIHSPPPMTPPLQPSISAENLSLSPVKIEPVSPHSELSDGDSIPTYRTISSANCDNKCSDDNSTSLLKELLITK